jgi:hypothetical protein
MNNELKMIWSWPNLIFSHDSCLEGLRKAMKNLREDNRSLGRDLNPGPPEYEASVNIIYICL